MSVSPFAPPPSPSPADLERQRHNAQRDQKRKAGTQALEVVRGATALPGVAPAQGSAPPTPPAPVSRPSDVPPQLGAPTQQVPQAQATPFTSATYKPPNKGLEYLALGLGVLFPGAPIARLAAGFAGGLNQGAEQRYQRNEQQSELQYGAAKDAAQTSFANQQAAYQASVADQQRDFENRQARYVQQQQQIAQGRFFTPPPALSKPSGTAIGEAARYRSLARAAMQQGAVDTAGRYDAQAEDYNRMAIDDANNARAMSVAFASQQAQYQREVMRENAADLRQERSEAAANAREEYRVAHEDARALRADVNRMDNLRQQALRESRSFYSLWHGALKPQPAKDANGMPLYQKDAQGNPVLNPATGAPVPVMQPGIQPAFAKTLGKAFSRLDQDTDPTTTAQWYADHLPGGDSQAGAMAKELLLARGQAADLNRRSQGLPLRPHDYPKIEPFAPAKMPGGGGDPAVEKAVMWLRSQPQDQWSTLVGGASSLSDPQKAAVLKALGSAGAAPAPAAPAAGLGEGAIPAI